MTMPEPRRVIAIITTVLVGLSAGFFVAYEVSVTVGLAEVDDVTYVHTFQAINATIRNVGFATIFFGSIPAGLLELVMCRAVTCSSTTATMPNAITQWRTKKRLRVWSSTE